jgi:predicted RNA methylase
VTGRGQGPEEPRYTLELDEREVERYRLMAEQARADEADLWELAGIGAGARVADVGCGPGAMLPALSAAVGPQGRVHALDGDPTAVASARALVAAAGLANVSVTEGRADRAGLRLADRLVRAGLEVLEFRGRYVIGQPPATVRPPSWAAREAMVTAGFASDEDVRRWERAFQEVAAAPVPPTLFAPFFAAVGRRPA